MTIVVSVVVPTCRRPELLDRCLQALVAQSFDPSSYEIIVADDADDPTTKRQILGWRRRVHGSTQILYAPVWDAHGSAAARNVGWRLAAGRVIAFTEDDTIPRRDWLARGMAAMGDDSAAAAGSVHVPLPHGRPLDYELDPSRLRASEFATANCFVRRDALAAIGGFDERFTAWREDADFFFSLLEAHGRVVPAPSAVVLRPMRIDGWTGSLRQQRKVLFDALLYKKHAVLYRGRIGRVPRWDYYAIVLSLIVAVSTWTAGRTGVAEASAAIWFVGTALFCGRRLRDMSHAPDRVLEVIATSVLIPPLAVFWRFVGAIRFGVFVG